MKATILAFLLIASFGHLSGQNDKMFVSLEYSPNFTTATQPYSLFNDDSYRFANNVFLKAGYKIIPNLYVNAGIGLLGTKHLSSYDLFNDGSEFDRIDQLYKHSYVVAPVGFTYFMGSFFVSPEIGIGWNVANKIKSTLFASDGSVSNNIWSDENNFYQVHQTTFPLFLSMGNEIKFNSWSIMLGIKGYYALNSIGAHGSNAGHYYGFGLLTGVKF